MIPASYLALKTIINVQLKFSLMELHDTHPSSYDRQLAIVQTLMPNGNNSFVQCGRETLVVNQKKINAAKFSSLVAT